MLCAVQGCRGLGRYEYEQGSVHRSHSTLKNPPEGGLFNGGEEGIRTLDTGLPYTPLAGERLQPLGHLSAAVYDD